MEIATARQLSNAATATQPQQLYSARRLQSAARQAPGSHKPRDCACQDCEGIGREQSDKRGPECVKQRTAARTCHSGAAEKGRTARCVAYHGVHVLRQRHAVGALKTASEGKDAPRERRVRWFMQSALPLTAVSAPPARKGRPVPPCPPRCSGFLGHWRTLRSQSQRCRRGRCCSRTGCVPRCLGVQRQPARGCQKLRGFRPRIS